MTEDSFEQESGSACAPVPTIIEFLLDETTSMGGIKEATIGGYNDFLDEQRNGDGSCLLTLTKFHSSGIRTPYSDIDVLMVPDMTVDTFIPAGSTNQHDAIMSRLSALERRLEQWDIIPRVMFVVMTDGMDNMSRHKVHEVAGKVREASARGWACLYLGANQNAASIGRNLGFLPENIESFETAEMRETMQNVSRKATAFRATSIQTAPVAASI